MEVGRHFVEEHQHRFATVKEPQPVLFVGRLRARVPEGFELVAAAKLVGDFTPEEMVGVVATVKRRNPGAGERLGVDIAATVPFAQGRMLREQSKADQQMGFTTTHRLLQMKDRLSRNTSESGHALADQILHALGNVGFLEVSTAISLRMDQFIELLDLVAEFDGKRIRLDLARVADGFHFGIGTAFTTTSAPRRAQAHAWRPGMEILTRRRKVHRTTDSGV